MKCKCMSHGGFWERFFLCDKRETVEKLLFICPTFEHSQNVWIRGRHLVTTRKSPGGSAGAPILLSDIIEAELTELGTI